MNTVETCSLFSENLCSELEKAKTLVVVRLHYGKRAIGQRIEVLKLVCKMAPSLLNWKDVVKSALYITYTDTLYRSITLSIELCLV